MATMVYSTCLEEIRSSREQNNDRIITDRGAIQCSVIG